MKFLKKCTALMLALFLCSPMALLSACGEGETPDNGGTNTDQGGSNTPDDGGSNTPDDGGSNTPDDGGSNTPDDGGSNTPDDGGSNTPDDGGSNTPDDGGSNTPDDDGSNTPDDGGETPVLPPLTAPTLTLDNNVARWEAVENATHYAYKLGEDGVVATTDGTYCTLYDGQTLYVKAVGDGVTNTDSEWATVTYTYTDPYIAPPAWDGRPTYNTDMTGAGSEYNRFEGTEGYYQINLVAGETHYYSFSISEIGQYALITQKSKSGLVINRCDASSQYISPNKHPAQVLDDGTLYSYVSCTEKYATSLTEWRATYEITCPTNADDFVIRFVRVGDPIAEPARNVTDVYAEEIKVNRPIADNPETEAVETTYTTFMKAPDMPSHITHEAPWLVSESPSYFYDADYEMSFTITNEFGQQETVTKKGFYRYGIESDENAPVIWVALTTTPSRLFSATFDTVQYSGNNLLLFEKQDVDGGYHFNNYVHFIMNNGGEVDNANGGAPVTGDENMPCYMNAVNADGLFPVNQELYEFLVHYTKVKPPVLDDGVEVERANYWLAPCYYYEEAIAGTENNPITLAFGENAVTLPARGNLYYKIEANTATQVTLNASAGLIAYINGNNYGIDGQGFSLTLDVPVGGLVLQFKSIAGGTYTATVTQTETV